LGEVDKETVSKILKKRARLTANKRITDAWLKEHKLDWDKFVDLFMNDPKDAYKLGMSKVFRLTPPSKDSKEKE
jgi:large subunit ribosomal protein L30